MSPIQAFAPVPVLYVHYGDQWIRGSENVLLQLFRRLDRSKVIPFLWCNGEPLAREAESLGVQTFLSELIYFGMPESPPFNLGRYLEQISRGRRLVRELKIKLIHANSAAPAQWMVPVARSCRIPLLAHIHAPYRRKSRLIFALPFADAIVGVSHYATKSFLSDGLPDGIVRVIYNGVDPAELESTAEEQSFDPVPSLPTGVLRIGVVGSLVRRKGQDTLLQAIRILNEKGIKTFTYFVGEGPERIFYEQLATSLEVDRDVCFVGERQPVCRLYRDFIDLLILPARDEALGLVLLEAACFGVPAIAAAVGGVPEVIREGVTGATFEVDNYRALAELIENVSADIPRLKAMGQAARSRIENQFSAERMTREFECLYKQLWAIPSSKLGWMHNPERLLTCLKLLLGSKA